MYKDDFDVEGIARDALQALLSRRMFDYTNLKRKLAQFRHFMDMNRNEIGGAYKIQNTRQFRCAQAKEEIEEIERGYQQ